MISSCFMLTEQGNKYSVIRIQWWNPKGSLVHWVVGRTAIEREYCLLLLLIPLNESTHFYYHCYVPLTIWYSRAQWNCYTGTSIESDREYSLIIGVVREQTIHGPAIGISPLIHMMWLIMMNFNRRIDNRGCGETSLYSSIWPIHSVIRHKGIILTSFL